MSKLAGFSSPFGSQTRTRILLELFKEETWGRELSRRLDLDVFTVQTALESLELDALVAGRLVGRTKLYRINPSYFAKQELLAYLARLVEAIG